MRLDRKRSGREQHMPSNKEVLRFNSYVTPAINIVKYVDTESESGNVMYDLYLNGKREQRYDIQGLLYRLELLIRTQGEWKESE